MTQYASILDYPRLSLERVCIPDTSAIVIFPGLIINVSVHARLGNLSGGYYRDLPRKIASNSYQDVSSIVLGVLFIFSFIGDESRADESRAVPWPEDVYKFGPRLRNL